MLASVNNVVRLFETYQKCEGQPVMLNEVTYLSRSVNDDLRGKHIWERRKDLSECFVRVGYINGGILLENKIQNRTNLVQHNTDIMQNQVYPPT